MEREWKRAHRALGPTGVAIMGSGQYTIQEGYAAVKLVKAGWRSNNLDPNARHCMASAVAAFMQTFGIDEPAGCYDDIELTDTVVLWGANMAEMHPMLWARIVDKRLRSPELPRGQPHHLRQPLLRRRRPRDRLQAQHRPRDLELHRPRDRGARRRGPGLRRASTASSPPGPTDIGYGMRDTSAFAFAAEKDTQAPRAGGGADPRGGHRAAASTRRRATSARRRPPPRPAPTGSSPSRTSRRRSSPTRSTSWPSARQGRPRRAARRLQGEAQGSSPTSTPTRSRKVGLVLDHGLQPAHARHLGERAGVHGPPAHRQAGQARQRRLLAHRPAVGLRHGARGRHLLPPPARRHGGGQPRAPRPLREALEAAGEDAQPEGRAATSPR